MNKWELIETAPKDGTEIFVYVRGDSLYPTAASYKSAEYFQKEYGDPNYMAEGWYWSFGYPSDFRGGTIEPSHWMPIPCAPGEENDFKVAEARLMQAAPSLLAALMLCVNKMHADTSAKGKADYSVVVNAIDKAINGVKDE